MKLEKFKRRNPKNIGIAVFTITCDYIYDNIVDYCVEQIEQGHYDKAYSRYKSSVLTLEEQFARPVLEQRLVKTLKLGR